MFITAALTAVDYCESHEEEAFAVTAVAPGIISEIAAENGAHVTCISTDMVFDGLKGGPYVETDDPHPISFYGASKLEGERRVLAASPANLVARVSWVFGPSLVRHWRVDSCEQRKRRFLWDNGGWAERGRSRYLGIAWVCLRFMALGFNNLYRSDFRVA